jgi:hypothetical protein
MQFDRRTTLLRIKKFLHADSVSKFPEFCFFSFQRLFRSKLSESGLKRGLIFLLYLQISMIFQSKKNVESQAQAGQKVYSEQAWNRKSESNQ